MMRPVLYGLGSALGVGIADAFAAVSTRRIGVLATMLVIQFVDVVALSLLLLTPVPGALRTTAGSTAAIIMTGVLGTLSFFLFYRALQLGPVAIVSPVFASSAAIPVVLSVALLGERLSRPAAIGAGLTLLGWSWPRRRRTWTAKAAARWAGSRSPSWRVAAGAWPRS